MTDEPRDQDEHLADVIRLPYANDDAIPSPADLEPKGHSCRHRFVLLISEGHKLECDARRCQGCGARAGTSPCTCPPDSWYRSPGCGAELDPWDWIQRVTANWRGFTGRYRQARDQANAMTARLEELERVERNAKSRIRSRGVTLTMGEARAARDQLRAMGSALGHVVGDREAALRTAHLHGFRKDDLARAVRALDEQIELREPST